MDPLTPSPPPSSELNPYEGQVLTQYNPSWRDKLASGILNLSGSPQPTEALKQAVQNTVGSLGAGTSNPALIDLTPVGNVLSAQEAAREGQYKEAAMAMLPGAPAVSAERRVAEKVLNEIANKPTTEKINEFIKSKFKFDNPATRGNTEWLNEKQAYAEKQMQSSHPKTSSGKGLVGATTAHGSEIDIPVSMLENVEGAYNEVRKAGVEGYDELMKKVKEEGWNPTPISIAINHKGQPYIYEGNTRTAIAKELGIPTIKADIQWLNGGELVEGPWSPNNVAAKILASPTQ